MQTTQHTAPSEIIQASELAQRLKCGKSTIYSLAKAGKIPTIGLGGKGVRFDYAAVLEALKK
jgi:excisionase family DNA binding protein